MAQKDGPDKNNIFSLLFNLYVGRRFKDSVVLRLERTLRGTFNSIAETNKSLDRTEAVL